MKKIVIFSGTTEGRMLSNMLAVEGIHHTVCVATDYGAGMMNPNEYTDVHSGRLDFDGMTHFLVKLGVDSDSVVIDATHPFATEVTSIIKSVSYLLGVQYIRISRKSADNLPDDIKLYEDLTECARALNESCGNILLTTGSKELYKFCDAVNADTKRRTYVRVLPSHESLKLCMDQGIEAAHIIAMQGPFGRELNEAIIRQYNIRHLVTKESGSAGGFMEKVEAVMSQGAVLHVLKRPADDEGIDVAEAYRQITGKDPDKCRTRLHISVAGVGMGATSLMTCALRDELSKCDAVFGAKRIIRDLPCERKYEMYRACDIIPVLEKENIERAVIAFSGDMGFYSGARALIKALKEWRCDMDVQIIPGISSFSYLASKLGESYDDALLSSLHGKDTEKDLDDIVEKTVYNRKQFVLLSGAGQIRELSGKFSKSGIKVKMYVGTNMSYEDENIHMLTNEEALTFEADGLITALILNPEPQKRPLIKIRRDSDFIRENIPMTKECIRHESIIRLGLREGDVLYDIGGGTGSVAIEAASLHDSIDVYSFEKKSEAASLIRKNAAELGTKNVTVIEGKAQDMLLDLPRPDCVFIGGSGGSMEQIVDILHSKGEKIRFVVNAVSLETIEAVRRITGKYKPLDEEAVMINVSEVHVAGSHHMLNGQNPVFIFSFTI
ncbi:MAG: precorrin-6A reductase [Butyrivibrio sp.]|nr:precorrin-6A reductase [Butyrivibrio sp.]